jgi:shikimate kinase
MPLVLVTGVSTSGKSSVAKELSKRGYEAYDTEHNGISAWYNKKTYERVAEFNEAPERSDEWWNRHEWRISEDWLNKIADKSKGNLIFICGGFANEAYVRSICKEVIWLKTNEETIRKRVIVPRDHDYGTLPNELIRIISANERKQAEYESLGAVIIDATLPLERVIDEILEKTA